MLNAMQFVNYIKGVKGFIMKKNTSLSFERTLKNRNLAIILGLFILCIISFFISVRYGSLKITIKDIVRAMFIHDGSIHYQIIYNVRLPRVLISALVGISLSLAGAILQAVMRNPLASPSTIGVNSGAAFMAYLILIVFPQHYGLVPMSAFFGAFITTLFIYALAWKDGIQPTRMILAGVAITSLLGAGIDSLFSLFPDKLQNATSFMIGGLSAKTWVDFNRLWPYTLIGIVLAFLFPAKLNILGLGDEVAKGLGLKVEQTRFFFIIIASLLAGSSVSVVGLISFVGLIVPHISRMLVGSDYRYLFPTTALVGALLLMLCDTLARMLFDPVEIPVGIILSFLGAPFFLYLLRKKKNNII
jgi:iron complex transport system permease protein